MRHDSQKAFPHPVLREGSSDYPNDKFSTKVRVVRTSKSTALKVSAKFHLTNTVLTELVSQQRASFVLFIRSPITFFRTVQKSTDDNVELNFSNGELAGQIILNSYLIAATTFSHFRCDSWHEDYSGSTFDIQQGSVLAIGESVSVSVDLAEESSVASIFRLCEDSELEDGMWCCDYDSDDNQVTINLSSFDWHRVKRFRINAETGEPNESLLNGLYFPALAWLLQECDQIAGANKATDYVHLMWYRSLDKKLEDVKCKKLGEGTDRLRDAQKILAYPFRNLPLEEGSPNLDG